MQVEYKKYNSNEHDKFSALTVKQPFADFIAQGKKTVELRTVNTKYRGKIVICSSSKPKIKGRESGSTIAVANIVDVIPVEKMTDDQNKLTFLPKDDPYWQKAKYGWILEDAKKLIEFPVKGQLGIWNLYFTKDTIIEYPTIMTE